ncbi:MAG: PEP-CTERM sorting domain-containing protein [Phycisphaerae bacterium]
MSRRIVIAVASGILGIASIARAGAVLDLVPDDPSPYYGGESLTVDFWLHNEESFNVALNFLRLDFSDSNVRFSLDSTFAFDFSSVPLGDLGYRAEHHPDLPVPWTWNTDDCVCPDARLHLPAKGSLHIGSIGVELPTDPGLYLLDVLNADEPDETLGAKFGSWRAYDGDVTGGVFGFVVVPEPATLSLLILGGFAALRQRRGASKGVSKSFPSLRRYRCSRSMCWESYGAGDHKDSRLGGVICSRS